MKSKTLWKFFKPYFTEKDSQYDQNMTIIAKKRSISEKQNVTNIFNKYFINITMTLIIAEWKPQKGLTFQNLNAILDIFLCHPFITKIKSKRNKQVYI